MGKMITQIWIGHCKNEAALEDFFEEIYSDDDEDTPISKFAASQNETWIDHDFMEKGIETTGANIKERFGHYSYSNQWIDKVAEKASAMDLNKINVIVFLGSSDDNKPEVKTPQSCEGEGLQLHYIGAFDCMV